MSGVPAVPFSLVFRLTLTLVFCLFSTSTLKPSPTDVTTLAWGAEDASLLVVSHGLPRQCCTGGGGGLGDTGGRHTMGHIGGGGGMGHTGGGVGIGDTGGGGALGDTGGGCQPGQILVLEVLREGTRTGHTARAATDSRFCCWNEDTRCATDIHRHISRHIYRVIHTHSRTHTYIYIYVYVYMYIYIHIHIYIYRQRASAAGTKSRGMLQHGSYI